MSEVRVESMWIPVFVEVKSGDGVNSNLPPNESQV